MFLFSNQSRNIVIREAVLFVYILYSVVRFFLRSHKKSINSQANNNTKSKMSRLIAVIAFLTVFTLPALAKFPPTTNTTGKGWKSYCEGNCTLTPRSQVNPIGGSIFMGGGTDVTAAFPAAD